VFDIVTTIVPDLVPEASTHSTSLSTTCLPPGAAWRRRHRCC
jgi:hypothetical protein